MTSRRTGRAVTDSREKAPIDFWDLPAKIELNNFKFKSLSSFAFNIAVGCAHACRFCYVPSAATKWQAPKLREHGVLNPDSEWGNYVLVRPWDEDQFLNSLRRAEARTDLKPDGNRAVIYCSTTDPYQTLKAGTPEKTALLNKAARNLVRRSLELILEKSTLNVRNLTRSPLAGEDFDLYKRFGPRLVFGMSLPTLDNVLARIYEPNAPSPAVRLKTLQLAKKAGLHVYVAMAPTYPECDEADLRRTLAAVKELDPITVFHEPINIRAENVARIAAHATSLGKSVNTDVFKTPEKWRAYAIGQLMLVERLAAEAGLAERLHLWPDKHLLTEAQFLKMQKDIILHGTQGRHYTRFEMENIKREQLRRFAEFKKWINAWHDRISEWPTK